jgi:uncharacterized protein YkwD
MWAAPDDLGPGVLAPPAVLSQRATKFESAVLGEINETRTEAGLRPLRLSRPLGDAASFHSREMAESGYFEHVSADGGPFWQRIRRFYPRRQSRFWAVGENMIWATAVAPADVVTYWLESPAHRATLLSSVWREIGLGALRARSAPGVFGGRKVIILTADFGTRR